MNNRFKFRYWHTKENKYIYTQCDCLAIKNTVLYSLIGKPNKGGWYETDIEKAYNGFELIPEQCTGLKDKNGNLIYEGDILQTPDKDQYIVEWIIDGYWHIRQIDDEKFGCALASIKTLYDGWEIIGNIHEQPEQKDVKCQ